MESPLSNTISSIYYFDNISEFFETKTTKVHEENDILTIENLIVQINPNHKYYGFLMREGKYDGKYYPINGKSSRFVGKYNKSMNTYFEPVEIKRSEGKWIKINKELFFHKIVYDKKNGKMDMYVHTNAKCERTPSHSDSYITVVYKFNGKS
ncbi:MAG: hypothetical protein ACOCP8_05485 [archaeon]